MKRVQPVWIEHATLLKDGTLFISLQPDGLNLWFFKYRLFALTEFIVWKIKGRRHPVAKALGEYKIRVSGRNSFPFKYCIVFNDI